MTGKKLSWRLVMLLLYAGCFFSYVQTYSQVPVSTVQQIMNNVYKVYDSIENITFDVRYTYTSDTMPDGNFISDGLSGTYTMAGTKAKYNLGDIDFVQNDSFFISIYNSGKYIVVADPINNNSNSVPMRQSVDSILQAYSAHYNISLQMIPDTSTLDSAGVADNAFGVITFTKADSLAQFNSFTITYDSSSYFLRSIGYVFQEPYTSTDTSVVPPVNQVQTKRLTIAFTGYRFENFSNQIFDEENYIFFEDNTWKPVAKYSEYRLFNAWSGNSRLKILEPAQ